MNFFYKYTHQNKEYTIKMTTNEIILLTDKQLVDQLIAGNDRVARYFFYEKCGSMFGYIAGQLFNYKINKDELINELYIYLAENNWAKVRNFNFQSKFTTWLSVVAIRFFSKKRNELIENTSSEALIIEKTESMQDKIQQKIDIEYFLSKITLERYRFVIQELILKERVPQELADEMEITIDNLYNIKRRALQQLVSIIKRDLDNEF